MLLFLIPLGCIAVIMEVMLSRIPNDYRLKKDYLDKNSSGLENLILGSSHAFYGLDPQYFKGRTFNAGYVSQTLNFDEMLLKQDEQRLTHLKVLILPVSYFSFYNKLEEGEESWRVVNYDKYYKLKFDHPWKFKAEIFTLRMNVVLHKLYKYYIMRDPNITSGELGSYTGFSENVHQEFEASGRASAIRHTAGDLRSVTNQQMLADNEQALRSILTICQKKNVRVFLLLPPSHEAYRMHLDSTQLITTIAKANEISVDYPNSIFINWLGDPYFDKGDFGDADHMSEHGAKKLSLLIDEIIHE